MDFILLLTKGAINLLTRDELSGVIAHELSHIINGDIELKNGLVSVLHGLTWIGVWAIKREKEQIRLQSQDHNYFKREDPEEVFIMLGVFLQVMSLPGILAARLIKFAVCRQRELLADATAVRLTRDPRGLASALRKILILEEHSSISNPKIEEFNHFFMAECSEGLLERFFSTHPSLESRILRLDKSFEGNLEITSYEKLEELFAEHLTPKEDSHYSFTLLDGLQVMFEVTFGNVIAKLVSCEEVSNEHWERIPSPIIETCYEPYGARALIYALLCHLLPKPRKVGPSVFGPSRFVMTRFKGHFLSIAYCIKSRRRNTQ